MKKILLQPELALNGVARETGEADEGAVSRAESGAQISTFGDGTDYFFDSQIRLPISNFLLLR